MAVTILIEEMNRNRTVAVITATAAVELAVVPHALGVVPKKITMTQLIGIAGGISIGFVSAATSTQVDFATSGLVGAGIPQYRVIIEP